LFNVRTSYYFYSGGGGGNSFVYRRSAPPMWCERPGPAAVSRRRAAQTDN